jgi:general secretion pathway protein A
MWPRRADARLPERLRTAELLPLGSRIRRRIVLDYASRDELLACLDHLLATAGNPSLMTTGADLMPISQLAR